MNIFTVLSQGNGRLNEENLSAMLGYLLSPTQTHGLGDTFLRLFLHAVAGACGDPTRFNQLTGSNTPIRAEMFLEQPYQIGMQRRVVDIELRLFSRSFNPATGDFQDEEVHRIAIENKVKSQTADPTQFREEFLGIVQDLEDDENVAITLVFLTPPGESRGLSEKYNALDAQLLGSHRKAWVRWAGLDTDSAHMVALLRHLLRQENEAAIAPIADYLRHTIKAFIRHIVQSPAGTPIGRIPKPRTSPESVDLAEVILVQLGDVVYQIERYASGSFRVFNTKTQQYVAAKAILRQANEEKMLGIDISRPGGTKNTRRLGREVMRALLAQHKSIPTNESL